MDIEGFKAMPGAFARFDVRYLPIPNTVDVVLTSEEAPAAITRSAFVLPLFENGDILLANNQRRGLEIPGGHIEAGETAAEAAVRECFEEAGCEVIELGPIGFLRLASKGEMPEGYRYPHPFGAQQFFAGRVTRILPYVVNDECGVPRLRTAGEVESILQPHNMAFYKGGIEVMRLTATAGFGIR